MRPVAALLVAVLLGSGLAACGGQRSTRDSNPEVEDQRLDQRREPPDATGDEAAPSSP